MQEKININKLMKAKNSKLRSANPDLLLLQRKDTNVTNKTYGWRAFNICAPFLWNKLPLEIRK